MDVDDDPLKKYQKANPMGKNSYANRWGNELNLRVNAADVLTLGVNYFPHPNVKLAFNWFYQYLDNPYTTDKVAHIHSGDEVPMPKGTYSECLLLLDPSEMVVNFKEMSPSCHNTVTKTE